VALSLLDGGNEVDRIEVWGVKIVNVTTCTTPQSPHSCYNHSNSNCYTARNRTVVQTAAVTKTEVLTVVHISERVYTTTVAEVVKEVDIRGVALAFLGVGTLGLSLVVFILSGRGGHVQEVRRV